jgi:ABC-2 type transport system permease protein
MKLSVCKKTQRYLRIFKILLRIELMTDIQYRLNFVFTFLSTTLWVLSELAFLSFLLLRYQTFAGWNIYEMALLVGFNQLWAGGVLYFIVWPSLITFAEYIKAGAIDKILTYPISTRYYISVFRINWASLSIVFNGVVIIIYSLVKLKYFPSIGQIILFFILGLLSYWIIYCIQFIASCLTFWLTNAGSYLYIISTLDRLSRFPYEIFSKGIFFMLFTFVVPVTIISNVPVRALIGILDWKFVLYTSIVAIIFSILSHVLWKLGIRRYESASS